MNGRLKSPKVTNNEDQLAINQISDPYRKCPGGTHLWTHAAARRRRIYDRALRFIAKSGQSQEFRPMRRASATRRATQSYGSLRRALPASGTWALSRRVAVGCTLKWIWETVSIARHSGVVTYRPESGSSDLGATLMFLAIPGATVQDQFRTVGGNPSK